MDISAIGSSAALLTMEHSRAGSLGEAVGIKMLDKALELNEDMEASMVKMLEQSVNPDLGAYIDTRI